MQTFLPSTNLALGISQLDTKRLLKQRVEAIQILRTLAGITEGWKHHPVAPRMDAWIEITLSGAGPNP